MAEELLSHILVEPSMSVNRKVTVPVGKTVIRCASSFPGATIEYLGYTGLPFLPNGLP